MSTPGDLQIKKLYKESVECVKYLDRLMTQELTDLSPIFSSKTVTIRNRLCEYCEKILFLKPLLYGKRADEIIWRKCYYEPVSKIRKRLRDLSENDRCQYYLLLSSASGHYTSLLIRIQQEFHFELPFSRDFLIYRQLPWNEIGHKNNSNDSESLKDFALNLSHRILIYLGDLARYQQDLCQPDDFRLAQYYYQWALRLKPFHGQPHNQLGTLYGDKNFGLDATFCYLRCIFSAESFMGADGNLNQLLQRNKTAYFALSEEVTKISKDDSHVQLTKSFILAYLYVFKLLFDDSEDNDLSKDIADVSEKVVVSFETLCQVPSSMNKFIGGPLLKIFASQMILIKKLQDKASYKTPSSIALLVRLFVVFLDYFSKLLPPGTRNMREDRFRANENGSKALNGIATNLLTINSPGKEINDEKVFAVRSKKVSTRPFLQRRRKNHDSDDEDVGTTDESDVILSDEDDVVEVEDSDEEIRDSDDIATTDGEQNHENDANNNEKDKNLNDVPTDDITENNDKIMESIGILSRNIESLAVVKVFCDWLRCHPTLVTPLVAIWPKLFEIVNSLPNDDEISDLISKDEKIMKELNSIKITKSIEFEQKIALAEDIYLRGIPPLTQAHTGLDFESIWSCSRQSEVIARTLSIRSFAHHLVKSSQSALYFDRKQSLFSTEIAEDNTIDDTLKSDRRPSLEKHRRETLMRNMAKLRIRDEMKSMEKVAWIPVYLILDSQTLMKSLSVVKRLLSRRKFILVVPESVLSRLDRLKKDDANAREAIRYLETQLKTGNKYIRSQKSEEKAGIDFRETKFSASLKECLDIQETKGVIDCASHFSRTVTGSRSTVACILTGSAKQIHGYGKVIEDEVDKMKVVNLKEIYSKLIEIAEVNGVSVEIARIFLERWQKHDGFPGKRNALRGRRRGNS